MTALADNQSQILKDLEEATRPGCFGYFHPDHESECVKNCDYTSKCRFYQVTEVLTLEARAMEYEDALRAEDKDDAVNWKDSLGSGEDPLVGRKFCFTGSIEIKEG